MGDINANEAGHQVVRSLNLPVTPREDTTGVSQEDTGGRPSLQLAIGRDGQRRRRSSVLLEGFLVCLLASARHTRNSITNFKNKNKNKKRQVKIVPCALRQSFFFGRKGKLVAGVKKKKKVAAIATAQR